MASSLWEDGQMVTTSVPDLGSMAVTLTDLPTL